MANAFVRALWGATRTRADDTPERVRRVAVAHSYRRYRLARSLHDRLKTAFGHDHESTITAGGALNEAWNSLQALKQALWT